MKPQVAVYVQRGYAKPTYARESYNVRACPGLEMVCDALRRAGIEVGYCSAATAGRYRVVLVSITSGCDWYPYVAERAPWARRHYRRPSVCYAGVSPPARPASRAP